MTTAAIIRDSSKGSKVSPRQRKPANKRTYAGKLAARIRELRDAKKMSAADLAKLCGVKTSTVFSWEQANSSPHIADLPKLAAAFGMTIAELLPTQ